MREIGEGLTALGAEVITTVVPASGSIETRSKALVEQIEAKAAEKSVNLIGYAPKPLRSYTRLRSSQA